MSKTSKTVAEISLLLPSKSYLRYLGRREMEVRHEHEVAVNVDAILTVFGMLEKRFDAPIRRHTCCYCDVKNADKMVVVGQKRRFETIVKQRKVKFTEYRAQVPRRHVRAFLQVIALVRHVCVKSVDNMKGMASCRGNFSVCADVIPEIDIYLEYDDDEK